MHDKMVVLMITSQAEIEQMMRRTDKCLANKPNKYLNETKAATDKIYAARFI